MVYKGWFGRRNKTILLLCFQTFFSLSACSSVLLNLSLSSSPNLLLFSSSSIFSLSLFLSLCTQSFILFVYLFIFLHNFVSCKFRWCTKYEISTVVYKTKICYAPKSMEETGYSELIYCCFFPLSSNLRVHKSDFFFPQNKTLTNNLNTKHY